MTTDHEAERLERKRQLALGYRIFAALRWGDLGDGHITARDPERPDCFWLLGHPVSFDAATVDDLVLVGPDGRVVEGRGPINNTAYYIHWPVHEARSDVVAAAHTHTAWGTPFATTRRLLTPITQEACVFHDDHSLFDDEEVQVFGVDGGKRIAAALGDNRAVILANHGILTVGASVAEAVASFVTMDRVAEAHLKAPDAVPISNESAAAAKADLGPERSLLSGFDFLVARHVGDPSVVDG
ncbi:MAG: class II aldolase/adducin family protein [Actinomycetota bacterium]